ncbi:MAG: hypothetical protein IT359_15220 [Gemmatimonadaceae bacterium]|nr:hypothetical protein [Gemmatimonadaceae bacterium]
MRIPVLRPMSLGEVLDTAFGIYRLLFVPLLIVSILTQSIPLAIGIFVESAGGPTQQPGLWALSMGLSLVLGSVGSATSTFLVAETYLGSALPVGEAFQRSTPYLGRLIGTSILMSLLMGVGFLFLIIPGIIIACGLMLTPSALVLEDIAGGTAAMGRSWALTKGERLKIFGALMVAVILLFIPGMAIGAFVVAGAGGDVTESTLQLLAQLVVSVLQILVFPFFYALTTVLYYDMRVRKEGFDLEMLATSLQQPG